MRNHTLAQLFAAALLSAVATGCADAPADLAEIESADPSADSVSDDESGLDEADPSAFVDKASCGGRWQLPADVTDAGDGMSVPYRGAGARCQGGPTSGAEALGRYIRSAFPGEVNTSVDGRGIQIYACRNIRGGSGLSVHATGRAIDVFIPTRGGAADNGKGDRVANWLIENADRIGIQMLIWDRTIWKASGGTPRDRCYQGTHPHNDHVHVEISADAADMNTPFFNGDVGAAPDANNGQADSPQASADSGSPLNRNAWVGDACRSNNDCAFSTDAGEGRCFLDHEPSSGLGFCTVSCAGYCPDRSGKAVTFCVGGSMLGANGGLCVSKSAGANDYCSSPGGFTAVEADRYIGGSSARNATAEVCLPSGG